MDKLSPERRSANMARVRSANTGPEIRVRQLLHSAGYRFRLHRKDLPGAPDIVLPRYDSVIFVHGCFWHRHPGCKDASTPKSRTKFWNAKFEENVSRDKRNVAALQELGWHVFVVWGCELDDEMSLLRSISSWLSQSSSASG